MTAQFKYSSIVNTYVRNLKHEKQNISQKLKENLEKLDFAFSLCLVSTPFMFHASTGDYGFIDWHRKKMLFVNKSYKTTELRLLLCSIES